MRKLNQYYDIQRRNGRLYSLALHLFFLLIAVLDLPSFFNPPPPEEPISITVELLPVTGITNLKPTVGEVKSVKKSEPKKAQPKPPAQNMADAVAPPPDPKKNEKPKEKPVEKKKADTKPVSKEDEMKALLDKLRKESEKNKATAEKTISTKYDPSLPMSLSEKDAVMSQIAKCWNVLAGAKDAENLVIIIDAEYNTDGSLIKANLSKESQSRAASDSYFRAAADSALRAVLECTPIKGLPPEKYHTWHLMELAFDPKFMLN